MFKHLDLTLNGASHAPSVGMKLRGIPAGIKIDTERLAAFMARRAGGRPGSTARVEKDEIVFDAGIVDGVTDGNAIIAHIDNKNVRRADYDNASGFVPRPGHADYTAYVKYGPLADLSGGGAFSGRMTAPMCIAGGIAEQILESRGIRVCARVCEAAGIKDAELPLYPDEALINTVKSAYPPCIDPEKGSQMLSRILALQGLGDSAGGIAECFVTGLPAGIGGGLLDGAEGRIAEALFSIPAVKGVEFGAGFESARRTGSKNNDPFIFESGKIRTETNHCGGILGGITDGMPLIVRAAFKPTPSISMEQRSVNLTTMEETSVTVRGRHDACVALRGAVAVEAMTALAVLDMLELKSDGLTALRQEIDGINREMTSLLLRRMELADKVAAAKRAQGLPTCVPEREKAILEGVAASAGRWQYEAETHMELLMALSRRRQDALNALFAHKRITLIGMPGCGKSVIGRALADYLGCVFLDTDALVDVLTGFKPADFIERFGVTEFRKAEQDALIKALACENAVIATGGGIVETPACREMLKKSSLCVWVERPLDALPSDGRPVTQSEGIGALYEKRTPLYKETACVTVSNTGSVWAAVKEIVDKIAR